MLEIIPALNCLDEECIREKVKRAKSFLKEDDWLHLDVADGCFTFHKTWGDAHLWKKLTHNFKSEVHLMIEDPEGVALSWIWGGVDRIILHIEALHKTTARRILDMAKTRGVQLMLSMQPETPVELVKQYAGLFSQFQILAVNPGFSGQNFLPTCLWKIKFLRLAFPGATIEVDGGINEETGHRAKTAGADILVSASYIFESENPKAAYKRLREIS